MPKTKIHTKLNLFDTSRFYVLISINALAVVFGVVYGIAAYIDTSYFVAVLDFSMVLVFGGVLVFAVIKRESTTPYAITFVASSVFFILLFATGGVANTGYLWSFLIPLSSLLLLGYTYGTIATVVYFICMLLLLPIDILLPNVLHLPSSELFVRIVSVYIIESIIAITFEKTRFNINKLLLSEIDSRKESENKLSISEENFRIFFNSIDDFLFVLDLQGIIVNVNDTVKKRLQYTADEIIGQSVLMVHPKDRQFEASKIVSEMLAGTADFCPVPLVTKFGELIQVETRIYLGQWNGKSALFGVTKDITNIKQTEERFAKAFDAGSSIMAISEIDTGVFVDVNEAFVTYLGYEKNEIIGKTSAELNLFSNVNERAAIMELVAKHGSVKNVEVHVRVKSGEIRVGMFSVAIIIIANKKCLLTSMVDITDRKQAEEMVKKSEAQLQRILDHQDVGVIIIDEQTHNIEFVNKKAAQLFGAEKNYIEGKKCNKFICVKDSGSCPITDLGQEIDSSERVLLNSEGKEITIIKSVVKEVFNGKPCLIETFIDIREQKNVENALVHAKQQAELASVAKSEFLAAMSHEIRTPLNGVIGFSDILLKTEMTKKQKEYLNHVKISAHSLLDLINDILDFSKIEAGKLDLNPEVIDVNMLVQNVMNILSYRFTEKQIDSRITIASNVPQYIIADPIRLRQVLINLVGNALKFTDTGEVELAVHVQSVNVKTSEVVITFSVRDTGIGISAEKQKVIFDAFTQADSSTTRKYGGTGLGLAISTSLVRKMGSNIQLESILGTGSKFFFTIKVPFENNVDVQIIPETQTNTFAISEIESKEITFLIVDDNTMNLKLASSIISMSMPKAQIIETNKSELACELFVKHKPHIVLLDIQMPILNGYEVSKQIRNTEFDKVHNIPIIAISAGTVSGERERCLEAGMNDYISKPIRSEQLLEMIHAYVFKIDYMPQNIIEVKQTSIEHYNKLALLQRFNNNTELVAELIEMACLELPQQLTLLQKAIETRNASEIVFNAHTIKGIAKGVEFLQLAKIATDIEASANNYEKNKSNFTQLLQEFMFVKGYLGM